MKASEIKDMTDVEVSDYLTEQQALLVKLRMRHTVTSLENPRQLAETKKNIARLLTEQRKRVLHAEGVEK